MNGNRCTELFGMAVQYLPKMKYLRYGLQFLPEVPVAPILATAGRCRDSLFRCLQCPGLCRFLE